MSTASACLLAASTVSLEDVYLRLRGSGNAGSVAQSRIVTFVFGVLMTAAECRMNDVIAAVTVAYDLLVGALLIPVVGAMLWKRGTGAGALTSIAVSGVVVVVLLFARGIDSSAPIYAGLGLGLASYVLVSLVSRQSDPGMRAPASPGAVVKP
jgi:SSS family solute:Na+ symporter